ncbi:hypothetical protein [Roseobacter litoralis]|uniref:hypothetical protein n=1 Tax=Roseobacter litoralis TaxID=42443 RepID=UPI0024951739|nr:hypothetical protein [Roseobacter litoralis]
MPLLTPRPRNHFAPVTPGPDALPAIAKKVRLPAPGHLTVRLSGHRRTPGPDTTIYFCSAGEYVEGSISHVLAWETAPNSEIDTRPVVFW